MIDSTRFGSIAIDGKAYDHDVIITWEGKVKEARTQTRHLIAKKEFFDLLFERPDVIVVGTGQYGDVEVSAEVSKFARKKKIKLIALSTPEAVRKFNELVRTGKKVVAYMHVTC